LLKIQQWQKFVTGKFRIPTGQMALGSNFASFKSTTRETSFDAQAGQVL